MSKKFIRVFLKSGTKFSMMGEEEIAIYCQCTDENPSVADVNVKELEQWVNGNSNLRRNQNRDRFIVSKELGSMDIITLEGREIQSCQKADRIFPRILNLCPGV
jgi:hypothetical protein